MEVVRRVRFATGEKIALMAILSSSDSKPELLKKIKERFNLDLSDANNVYRKYKQEPNS